MTSRDIFVSISPGQVICALIIGYMCVCSQSCPTLCDPMDCSPPGSSGHGIFQARILMGVGRLSFLIPGDLPNPGIEPVSLVSAVLAGGLLTTVLPGKTSILIGSNKLCTSHYH